MEYEFLEMHFHWGNVAGNGSGGEGSEHTIDGNSYPAELHMVHRNIHDEEVSEALEHENGLTVLGFKFQVVKRAKKENEGMNMLAKIASEFLVEPNSKFDQEKLKTKVISQLSPTRNCLSLSVCQRRCECCELPPSLDGRILLLPWVPHYRGV